MCDNFKNQFNAYLRYIVVNQKFQLVHNYLDDGNFNELINHALDYMNGYYPIRNILYLPHDPQFQNQMNIKEKQEFIMTILEYFYNYAKNLLWNFDIYKMKTITFDSQQLKEIMEIPQYEIYLSLLDYEYVEGKKEWKLKCSVLKNGQKHDLICATIWCCVAAQYFSESIYVWKLNEFKNDADNLIELCRKENCEECGKIIDTGTFCCSNCQASMKNMQFYLRWKYYRNHEYVESSIINESIYQKNSLNSYNYSNLYYTKSDDESDGDILNIDTILNDLTNCDFTNFSYTDYDDSYCEKEENKENSNLISRGINFTDNTDSESNLSLWTCKCSFINKPTQMNCEACLRNKPEITQISNKKSDNEKSGILNKNNQPKDVKNVIVDLSISENEKKVNLTKISQPNSSNNENDDLSNSINKNKSFYKTFDDTNVAANKPHDENNLKLFCCCRLL